jgi:hypothetical protein
MRGYLCFCSYLFCTVFVLISFVLFLFFSFYLKIYLGEEASRFAGVISRSASGGYPEKHFANVWSIDARSILLCTFIALQFELALLSWTEVEQGTPREGESLFRPLGKFTHPPFDLQRCPALLNESLGEG